ncbi:hypothetical protein [Actinomadura montaniterrae]|uniref:Uncharacterized protein n=1 Tax=Actinomadura montaniterrae TaxID=1803903 RepID=A0A6L3VK00_9ACTN|nr:hypothetical protein [Actinomadura montaniterrae]KAB2365207.1 hypothetical protein F9B16_40920 [Actinomadura montaniterrae]
MSPRRTPPRVRVVKVRLSGDGDGDDARQVAELLAWLLPALSEGRCQVGEISAAYPNRRGADARRYLDLYLLDHTPHDHPGDRPTGAPPGQVT